MSATATLFLLTWLAITLLAFAMAGLLRQIHYMSQVTRGLAFPSLGPARLLGLPAPRPPAEGPDWSRDALLLFSTPSCPTCRVVTPEFLRLTARVPVETSVLSSDPGRAPEGCDAQRSRCRVDQKAAYEKFGVQAVPFLVHVDEEGIVRVAEPVGSVAALHGALDRTLKGALTT